MSRRKKQFKQALDAERAALGDGCEPTQARASTGPAAEEVGAA